MDLERLDGADAAEFLRRSLEVARTIYRVCETMPKEEAIALLVRWIRLVSADTARCFTTPNCT